jgi:hypothetical protein
MTWREHHPMPYQSKLKEKFLGPFSLSETAWLGFGLYLSYQLSKLTNPFGDDIIFSRIHYLIPLGITAFLAFGRHPRTGLAIGKYVITIVNLRRRRRKFLYRKVNIIEGGDR